MNETIKFVLNALAVVVLAVVAVRLAFMEVVVVRDNGMAPTLVYGDEVLVWKGAKVDMTDVVVCQHPARDGVLVVSRAVAFAGHTVSTDHNGMLYVDGNRTATQAERALRFYDIVRQRMWDMQLRTIDYFGRHSHAYFLAKDDRFQLQTTQIERGVYLLGDNRSEFNYDSREFGEVALDRCIGQVFMRLKPGPQRGDDVRTGYFELIE